MSCKGETFALLLVALFIASLVMVPHSEVKAQTRTLIVPDQYPTIRSAIDNASPEDTVFVKNGVYLEFGIYIDKPLKIMGQNPNKTIISGNNEKSSYPLYTGQSIFMVTASNVEISGFTFTSSEVAISISGNKLNRITITGNNFVDNFGLLGSTIGGGGEDEGLVTNLLITENYIHDNTNETAIGLGDVANSSISNNIISANLGGGAIELDSVANTDINNNTIYGNSGGITLDDTSNVKIYGNNITDNNIHPIIPFFINELGYGINFSWNCNNTLVYNNNISYNSNGVNLENFQLAMAQGLGSKIYENNFYNNSKNANVEHAYYQNILGLENGTDIVSWDNDTVGNYWSDYQSKYPNATEVDASGIGNTPYIIDQNNIDNHPLTQQVNVSAGLTTPTPILQTSTFIQQNLVFILPIAVTIVILTVVSLLLLKRHRKTASSA